LLDEDGQIFDTKTQKLNFGKCFTKRYGDTVALLRQGPETIAWVQTQTAQLVAQKTRCADSGEFFRLKMGSLTMIKVPSQTASACGL